MKEEYTKAKKLNPFKSLLTSIFNWITFQIHFPKTYNRKLVKMQDGAEFEIFRHVVVGNKALSRNEKGAIFIVRFKLSEMSVEKNIKFSRFPIPMFIGLHGFRAKFWLLNRKTGYNQGVYQWKTEQDAINYSKSFAVDFMTKRSESNSVSYEIIPNENIYDYIDKFKSEESTLKQLTPNNSGENKTITIMNYKKLLPILLFILFIGCAQEEEGNIVESSYVLETSEGIYEKEGEYPGTSATVHIPTSRTITKDSIIVKLISGWGERIPDPFVLPKNTLFVSFINRFADGGFVFESQFSDWLKVGTFPIVSDGDSQIGIGIIWFDEHGDIWISGKHIGEESIIGDLVRFGSSVGNATTFQENSNFNIIKSVGADFENVGYDFSRELEMQFNCTLYNSNNDSIEVKNATFKTFFHYRKTL